VEPRYPHDRPDPSVNNGINYTTKKNIAQGEIMRLKIISELDE
jgi:hypothetical protein